jgi:hypothetical protein
MEEKTKIEKRKEKDKRILTETLKETPIIQIACRKAGISRSTYYRWQKEDKKFFRESEDALRQGIEFINDLTESQVINLIKEKKMGAISLWLKNNHEKYGAKKEKYIPINIDDDLTSDEQKIIEDALALVSNNKKHEDSK